MGSLDSTQCITYNIMMKTNTAFTWSGSPYSSIKSGRSDETVSRCEVFAKSSWLAHL